MWAARSRSPRPARASAWPWSRSRISVTASRPTDRTRHRRRLALHRQTRCPRRTTLATPCCKHWPWAHHHRQPPQLSHARRTIPLLRRPSHLDIEMLPKEHRQHRPRRRAPDNRSPDTILLVDGQILDPEHGRTLPAARSDDALHPLCQSRRATNAPRSRSAPRHAPPNTTSWRPVPTQILSPAWTSSLPRFAVRGIYANFGLLNWNRTTCWH